MSYIPPDFQARLMREFDGRFRIRFSGKTGTYHVEMQAGRPEHLPFDGEDPDDAVRLQDGYQKCFELQRGPRMPCPQIVDRDTGAQCGLPLDVPFRRTAEVVCAECRKRGYDARATAAYFPFDDHLLAHLRKLDPRREWRLRVAAETELANRRRNSRAERGVLNTVEDVNLDIYNKLTGIESFGYTGRHDAWINPPDSPGHAASSRVPAA